MKSFLDEIVAVCRARLEVRKAEVSLDRVREAAARRMELAFERRDFTAALSSPVGTAAAAAASSSPPWDGPPGLRVIAELKQASPSRGVLRAEYCPREIASGYEAAGAAALSVLTEEQFFKGSLGDLEEAREAVSLPVLRKDFILEPYQVYESAAAGADALLLIVAALTDAELRSMIELAYKLEMGALVEVHNEEETRRAIAAGARVMGVNNRDLRTFEVKLETSLVLRDLIPAGILTVSESGIGTANDLDRLRAAGFDAVLIGERLITQADPGQALRGLLEGGVEFAQRQARRG